MQAGQPGDTVTGRSSWAALSVSALVGASGLAGCGLADLGRRNCTPEADAVVQRLEKSPILDVLPPGATAEEIYAKRPCEDEDHLGYVGRPMSADLPADALLTHFREEFSRNGWTLKFERAEPGGKPAGLDLGVPDQCYENPAEPNVTLEVSLHSSSEVFVEFRLTGNTYSCANTTPPPMTR